MSIMDEPPVARGVLMSHQTKISPCNLLIFPLSRLYYQALFVHFVYVACRLHVAQYIVLEVADRFQWVWHILILLDVTDNLSCLSPFGKVDQIGLLDDRWNTVLDERQVGKVNTLRRRSVMYVMVRSGANIPKKGIHGGFAQCNVSRYSPKFLVLPMSLLIDSRTVRVRAFTWVHVRLNLCMGAVPSAEMIEVSVEKLFIDRHFYFN